MDALALGRGEKSIRDWIRAEKKEKGREKNSKKEGKTIPNRKSWDYLDCDENQN